MWWRVLLVLSGLWCGGFLKFNARIPHANPIVRAQTDAIVALTGGEGRLVRALELVREKHARRLFISGVNKTTSTKDLQAQTGVPARVFACCVDIGHSAGDTIGNAAETATWIEAHRFKSIRLVTSRVHMQRALLEFRARMRDVIIVPEPVDGDQSLEARVHEFHKYTVRLVWLRLKTVL